MKINRYTAPTIREAMQLMRRQLGGDAVILSSSKVGGQVEVVGAIDYDEELLRGTRQDAEPPLESLVAMGQAAAPRHGPAARTGTGRPTQSAAAPERSARAEPTAVAAESPSALDRSVAELKDLVENHLLGLVWQGASSRRPNQAAAARALLRAGFDAEVSRRLVDRIPRAMAPERAMGFVFALLARKLDAAAEQPIHLAGGRVVLVGPPGSGKTAVAVKLAALAARVHGAHQVALVGMDSRGIGAEAQIHTFGQVLGIGVRVAHRFEELPALLGELDRMKFIAIDTASLVATDAVLQTQRRSLSLWESAGLDVTMVLPAHGERRFLAGIIERYATPKCSRCVITHFDEAPLPGVVLSAVLESGLTATYTTSGLAGSLAIEPFDGKAVIRRWLLSESPSPGDDPRPVEAARDAHAR